MAAEAVGDGHRHAAGHLGGRRARRLGALLGGSENRPQPRRDARSEEHRRSGVGPRPHGGRDGDARRTRNDAKGAKGWGD